MPDQLATFFGVICHGAISLSGATTSSTSTTIGTITTSGGGATVLVVMMATIRGYRGETPRATEEKRCA
jgi:hypothetical protein